MPTFAPSLGTDASKRGHRPPQALPGYGRAPAGTSARGPVAPQSKSHCACGGSCPRCRGISSKSGATVAARQRDETQATGAAFHRSSTPLAGKEQTHDPGTSDEQVLTAEAEQGVLAPTPAATTYPGCSTTQNGLVDTARTTARTKATAGAAAMTALKAGTGTTAQQTALTGNFGTLTSAQYDTAKTTYTTISTRLGNAALFACGSAPAQSYCGPPDNWCAGTVCPTTTGISYLCPNAFTANCAEPNLWSIMLHESGRAAGCCPPDVQPGATGYPPAAPACLTNVYSYSGFARAI